MALGNWSGGQQAVPLCRPVIGNDLLPNVHGACCIINPIDALSPGHCTLTCGDIVIEHIDFYGSVHSRCIVIRRRMQCAI